MHVLLSFFCYSFLGWVCECIYCGIPAKKFINRGFLAGPYCPIYGCGAMLVIMLLKPFEASVVQLFIMGVLVTSALEYMTSYLMEILFHTKWWDYSTYPYNLHGRICLKNSMMFGILVIIVYYGIHPAVLDFISSIPTPVQTIITIILVLGFGLDTIQTTLSLLRKNKDFMEVESCMRTLLEDFAHADYHPHEESLREMVQRILDATDADEILLSHIDKFRVQMESLHMHHKKTHMRLARAFPTMKEALNKKDAESIFHIISNYKKKVKEEGKKS